MADATHIAINPRLDLFKKAPINVSNKEFTIARVDPQLAIVPNTPITFLIRGDTTYINLEESLFRFKIRIVQHNGNNLRANQTNHVTFVNNIFGSAFKTVRCRLNGTDVTPTNDLYGYKSYIETLCSATGNSSTRLALAGFDLDTGDLNDTDLATNPSFRRRCLLTNESRDQEVVGRPHIDLWRCGRNILPNVDITVQFYPAEACFAIQHDDTVHVAGQNFTFVISDAHLMVRREVISVTTALAIEKKLFTDTAKYFFHATNSRQFQIPQGSTSFRADDIFNGVNPYKVIVFFVNSLAFAGQYVSNPYYLSPTVTIRYIELDKNSKRQGHQRSVEINLAEHTTDLYTHYMDVLNATGNSKPGDGLIFGPHTMQAGNFIYMIDLTPDGLDHLPHRYPTEITNASIHADWGDGTPYPLDCVVMRDGPQLVEINAARIVTTNSAL